MTDAGATLQQVQGLAGQGPQGEPDRRVGLGLSASGVQGFTADVQGLEGEGPQDEVLRRDARITDGGETLNQLQGMRGAGPQE